MQAHERREALLGWLRGRQSGTAAEAAQRFRVTERTILRDITALRDRGEPISSSSGPGGGFQLDTLARLQSVRLTVEEVVGLTLAVATARQVAGGIPYARVADHAIDRLISTLPRERATRLRHLMQHVAIGEPAPSQMSAGFGEVEHGFLSKFEAAFSTHRVLSFAYTDRKEQATRRAIEPHGLLLRTPIWYVIAHDRLRDAPRMFRVDRMREVVLLDEPFTPRPPSWFEEHTRPYHFTEHPAEASHTPEHEPG